MTPWVTWSREGTPHRGPCSSFLWEALSRLMKANTKSALRWSLAALSLGLVVPSLVILVLEVFLARMNPLESLAGIAGRQFSEGDNLFLIAALGLIPFLVFSGFCVVASRWLSSPRLACVAVGGLLGILALMIPAHVAIWYPLYGGGGVSSTGAIAFLFIPIFCVGSLLLGLLIGWLVSLLPVFTRG